MSTLPVLAMSDIPYTFRVCKSLNNAFLNEAAQKAVGAHRYVARSEWFKRIVYLSPPSLLGCDRKDVFKFQWILLGVVWARETSET